jgi:hypothetical protein
MLQMMRAHPLVVVVVAVVLCWFCLLLRLQA